MKEKWKSIQDYEGIYEVSNLGRIRSISQINMKDQRRKTRRTPKYRYLVGGVGAKIKKGKYRIIYLGKKKGIKPQRRLLHRIVANAFIENPFKKPFVNHKDGNPNNNRVSNLEWSTHSENMIHSFRVLGNMPTKETIKKQASKRCKKVIDTKTGKIYKSVKDFANEKNIRYNKVVLYLNGYLNAKWKIDVKFLK